MPRSNVNSWPCYSFNTVQSFDLTHYTVWFAWHSLDDSASVLMLDRARPWGGRFANLYWRTFLHLRSLLCKKIRGLHLMICFILDIHVYGALNSTWVSESLNNAPYF